MAFISPDFVMRAANNVFADQLHIPLDRLIGRPAKEVVEDWTEHKEPFYRQVRETGRPFKSGAFPMGIKGQPERGVTYWDFTVSPVYAGDGSFIGYLLISNDVTEKKRAEEDLARLASIVQASDVAMAHMTLDGIVLDWNRGAERFYGYSAEEMKGKAISILVPPDRAGETARLLEQVGQGEPISHLETVRMRKDGSLVDVSLNISPVMDNTGQISSATWIAIDITERKRMEEKLRESEERFRNIYEESPIAIELYDSRGRLVDANKACLDLFGVPEVDYVRGFPLLEDPNMPDEAKEKLRRGETVRYESPFSFDEVRKHRLYRTAKSGTVHLDVVITPLDHGPRKSLGGYLVQVQDVSERRKAEEALRNARDEMEMRVEERTGELAQVNEELRREIAERKKAEQLIRRSEARFRKVFEEGPLGIAIVNRDFRFLDVNPMFSQITGYTKQELGKLTFVEITYPEDITNDVELAQRLFSGDLPYYQMEKRYVRKGGEIIWISLLASLVRDDDGNPLYSLSMVQDISERKQAEKDHERLMREVEDFASASRRRARELETVIRSLADALLVCDKEGRIVDLNEAALKQAGLTSREDVPSLAIDYLRLLNIRYPDGRPVPPNDLALTKALNGEVVTGLEEIARNPRTGSDFYLLVSSAPIRDREGNVTGIVEVMSDISRLKELDRLKDEFIAVAAHELKTPVTIMKGYAQALLRLPDAMTPSRRKMLEAINRGSDRIDRIVRDLLEISRLQLGQLELARERLDLADFVQEVVSRSMLTATKHTIKVARAEPAIVRADRNRIEQVLVNLIDNAMKYSPGGGEVDVAVLVEDREAVVSVKDYGVGIPRDKQARIFERFYSAHIGTPYDYGGPAAGLHISREIISRHGGRMWFESEEGKGSTFYFSLPLVEGNGGT